MAPTIRRETSADRDAIGILQDAAFGTSSGIPALIEDLRRLDAPFRTLSLVATAEGGALVGHVMASHAWLDAEDRLRDVMVLSPLGVLPAAQGTGIGTALVDAISEAARKVGAPLLFLEGSPRFYGRCGFEAAMPLGFRRPSLRIPQAAFQVRVLAERAPVLTGTFVYRDVHWRHGVGLYRRG